MRSWQHKNVQLTAHSITTVSGTLDDEPSPELEVCLRGGKTQESPGA